MAVLRLHFTHRLQLARRAAQLLALQVDLELIFGQSPVVFRPRHPGDQLHIVASLPSLLEVMMVGQGAVGLISQDLFGT